MSKSLVKKKKKKKKKLMDHLCLSNKTCLNIPLKHSKMILLKKNQQNKNGHDSQDQNQQVSFCLKRQTNKQTHKRTLGDPCYANSMFLMLLKSEHFLNRSEYFYTNICVYSKQKISWFQQGNDTLWPQVQYLFTLFSLYQSNSDNSIKNKSTWNKQSPWREKKIESR